MSTRSLVRIFNAGREIACIYQKFDGYPSAVGVVLANFLGSRKFVNGIGEDLNVFNGTGCFAAQFIAHIKAGPGGVYLYPAGATDVGEEYVYEVRGSSSELGAIQVKCIAHGEDAYSGDIAGFKAFCDQDT